MDNILDIETASRVWQRVTASDGGANYSAASEYGDREGYAREFSDEMTARRDLNAAWRSGNSSGMVMSEPPAQSYAVPTSDNGEGTAAARETLVRFMNGESGSAGTYWAIASSCRDGEIRRMFQRMSADERRHLRKLQAAHFILTGDTYLPPKTQTSRVCLTLSLLRESYTGEIEASRSYLAAAEREQDAAMAEDYRTMAADEERHACQLRALMTNMMG